MTLLFDLDGTLVDCKELHYHALNGALKMNGYNPISRDNHEAHFDGLPTLTKLSMLNIENAKKVNQDKQDITMVMIPTFVEKDEKVVSAIKSLHKQYRLFCVSNSKKNTIEAILKQAGLLNYFSQIISCEEVKNPKPAPDIYQFAKQLAQDKCVAFEDNIKGLISADSAGIKCFHVIDSSHIRYDHIINLIQYA